MGDSGPTNEVGTFSSRANDLYTRGILPVVYPRDCSAIWSVSVHSVGHRSQIYDALLEELLEGHRDTVDYEHCISSADGWLVGEDHTDFRGYAASMRPGS